MPPRTGPRRKRRVKQAPLPARHFTIWRTDNTSDLVIAHSVELADRNLVLRDAGGAICHIIASGGWREIRLATIGDIPYADKAGDSDRIDSMQREEATLTPLENREQATLVNENDPVFQPTRKEEEDRRFVPSSPQEAQRILMELERRLQDPPNAPPPPPIRKD